MEKSAMITPSNPNPNQMDSNVSQSLQKTKLNLDITCLIAYVSSLCDEESLNHFNDPIFIRQALYEEKTPVKKKLDSYFEGKTLCACKSAVESFKKIIESLAGPKEKNRADELLKNIEIIDDKMSLRVSKLKVGKKIKNLTKLIFGTGDYYNMTTVSSNRKFILFSIHQGLNLQIFLHEPRSLAEKHIN